MQRWVPKLVIYWKSKLTCNNKTRSLNFAKRNWLPCAKIGFLQTEFGPEIAQGVLADQLQFMHAYFISMDPNACKVWWKKEIKYVVNSSIGHTLHSSLYTLHSELWTLSYLPCHIPSLSYLPFHTFPVIRSLSYLPCHTFPVIPFLSYLPCHTLPLITFL